MHSGESELKWVKPPAQARSQETLERILAAAESLILEVGFEGATVAEIVKRAQSSVGSFYTRFKDKDALLHCLMDRFVEEVLVTIDSSMRPEVWKETSFEAVARSLVRFMMRMMAERARLLKAISRVTMTDLETGAFREALIDRTVLGLSGLLEARGERITCKDPQVALRMVAWMCIHLFEASVVQNSASPAGISKERCEEELCEMILAYLQIESAERKGEA